MDTTVLNDVSEVRAPLFDASEEVHAGDLSSLLEGTANEV